MIGFLGYRLIHVSSANIFFERLEEGWGGAASHHPFPAFREVLTTTIFISSTLVVKEEMPTG